MENLEKHIDEFEKLMNQKGFDGYFHCNSDFPGKLKDSLHQHLLEVFPAENHLRPFHLSTYSLWKDDLRPYVQCNFKVRYDTRDGFRIDKVEAKYANQFGTIRDIEIRLTNNADMPSRQKVNSIIGPRKKSMKL